MSEQQPAQPSKEEVKAFVGRFFTKPSKPKSPTAARDNNSNEGVHTQSTSN